MLYNQWQCKMATLACCMPCVVHARVEFWFAVGGADTTSHSTFATHCEPYHIRHAMQTMAMHMYIANRLTWLHKTHSAASGRNAAWWCLQYNALHGKALQAQKQQKQAQNWSTPTAKRDEGGWFAVQPLRHEVRCTARSADDRHMPWHWVLQMYTVPVQKKKHGKPRGAAGCEITGCWRAASARGRR